MTNDSTLHTTVAVRVAEQLSSEIRAGAIAAGEPLRQNGIAARLGVSSTPVREAFQILEQRGLVVREGRRGVRVFRPSVRDLVNSYAVRGALESLAARLSAMSTSDADLAAIQATMDRMHARGVSNETFLTLNAEFHAQIARASGNDRLAELIVAEQANTTSFVVFLGVDPSGANEAHDEHRAILEALVARDQEAAAAAMQAHLVTRVDALRSRLNARNASR